LSSLFRRLQQAPAYPPLAMMARAMRAILLTTSLAGFSQRSGE
jgi:hypothetical protein